MTPEPPSTPAAYRVERVASRADREAFIDLPFRLHARRRFWVPPLRRDLRRMMDPRAHPFYRHAEVEFYLAREARTGQVVGRVAAIANHRHNEIHRERTGFFGFLEAVDDREVFRALLARAAGRIGQWNLDTLRGPCSFSTNEECGTLVEGFDRPTTLLMPYNPPYYPRQIEALGARKAMALLSSWSGREEVTQRLFRLAGRARARLDAKNLLRVRPVELRRFTDELRIVQRLYNSAWEKNWGFVPMTDEEIEFMARELKPVIDPRVVLIAEYDGAPAGFALAVPDVNPLLKILNGRLTPLGLLQVALMKRSIQTIRVMALGLLPEFRHRGLDVILYAETARRGLDAGYEEAEFSWILETNQKMNQALEGIGGRVSRRHRLYEWSLPAPALSCGAGEPAADADSASTAAF